MIVGAGGLPRDGYDGEGHQAAGAQQLIDVSSLMHASTCIGYVVVAACARALVIVIAL